MLFARKERAKRIFAWLAIGRALDDLQSSKEEVMSNRIKRSVRLAALSAGIMYLFDPDLGKRRRSFLRDQFHRGVNRLGQRIDVLGQDLENRLIGKVRELDG